MNGNAVRIACGNILKRLLGVAGAHLGSETTEHLKLCSENVLNRGEITDLGWDELVNIAYLERVNLSSHVHYSTPGIHFNKDTSTGVPFAYHVAGTALTEVTLDRLRGTYTVDAVRIVHDCGDSIAPLIDRGQIEGGLLQGIGWVTIEELKYDTTSMALLTDSLATYKIPDIYSAPTELDVEFLECHSENAGVFNSKAVGEPPFMYGIGTYFALLDALGPDDADRRRDEPMTAPITTEILLGILIRECKG